MSSSPPSWPDAAGSARILSVDIGTSSLKAALFDFEGREWGGVRELYAAARGVSAEDWEAVFSRAAARLLSPGEGRKLRGICISGNGPTLIPVTSKGRALPPLHWYDSRIAAPQGGAFSGPDSFFLPRAAWFAQNRSRDYEETRYFFSTQEWLSYRLGAEAVTVLPSPAYEPYYWNDLRCRAYGIDRGKFPPFAALGSRIGRVGKEGARIFGLPQGIPLIAGGPDFFMALIGAGVLEPGMVCDRAGSSEGINICATPRDSRDLPSGRNGGFRLLPHVREGLWNIGAVIPASGSLFEWFRRLTGQDQRDYGLILADLIPPRGTVLPGTGRFLPGMNLGGDAAALITGPGLPGQKELGGAVLESMVFQVRAAVEALEAQGFPVREMRLSGGQAKNPQWNQFKADGTAVRLLLPETADGELMGNACTAAWALGEASTLIEAAGRMIRIREQYEPDPRTAACYKDRFHSNQDLRERFLLRPA